MKTVKFLLAALLIMVYGISVNAQMVRVYKNGEIVGAFGKADSIVYVPAVSAKYVDLGLPSGTMWATCNVGAGAPEDVGDYYQWGCLTVASTVYDALNHPLGYPLYGDPYYTLENGNRVYHYKKYSAEDGKTVLESEDDIATQLYGDGWQIPSEEQARELYENTETTEEVVNGKPVFRCTAKNGNSIILPKSGMFICNLGVHVTAPDEMYFWLNTLWQEVYDDKSGSWVIDKTYVRDANVSMMKSPQGLSAIDRYYGLPVRPVYVLKK